MAEEGAELATYRNHARVLQVESLLKNTAYWISERRKTETEPFKAQAVLLTTWPIVIDEDFPKGSVKREKLFSGADESFKIAFEEGFVLQILSETERAVGERDLQTTYISLDKPTTAYPAVNIIYRGREKKLEEIREEGFLKGRVKLLQMLSGEVPLAVWRIDLAERFLPLEPAVDGGEVGFLPTVISNVLVRYYYSKESVLPLISLEVRPFS